MTAQQDRRMRLRITRPVALWRVEVGYWSERGQWVRVRALASRRTYGEAREYAVRVLAARTPA